MKYTVQTQRLILRGCDYFVTLNFPAGTNNKVIIGAESPIEQDIIYQNALKDRSCSQVRKRKGQLPDYPNADTRNYIMKERVLKSYAHVGEEQYEDGDRFCLIQKDFEYLDYFREFYTPGARTELQPFEPTVKEIIKLMISTGMTDGEYIVISPADGAILHVGTGYERTEQTIVNGLARYRKEPQPLMIQSTLEDYTDGGSN